MPRFRAMTLLLSLSLAACQGGKPVVTSTKVTAAPVAPRASTVAGTGEARRLQKPAAGARTIAGTLTLDAGYMATVGAGRAVQGAYAVADASLIANNAGNIISEHGAGLISNNGGTLLSDNGGALIAPNGGSLVANNGGALTGKVKRGLLADAAPGLGSELPIGGMWVAVIGLKDGAAVPVGVDEAGKPVYVVHSDAKGHYELYLPPGLKDTVRVVAAVPDAQDGRLNYNLLVAPTKGQDDRFDEATALTSDYTRRLLTGELVKLGVPTESGVAADDMLAAAPPGLAAVIRLGLQPFVDELERPEVRALSKVRRQRAMQHAIDVFLASVDLEGMQTIPVLLNDPSAPEPALAAATRLFGTVSAKAALRVAADPTYFEHRPYVVEANLRRAAAGLPPIAIRRPSDVGRFLVEEYARSHSHERDHNGWVVAVDLGLPASLEDQLHLIFESLFIGLAQLLIEDDATRGRLVAAEKTALAAELAASEPKPEPVASPPFVLPKEGAYDLGTLITAGEPLKGLALGADGVLYVSHGTKIQKVDPKAPELVDVGTLGQPNALAFDGSTGKLFAVDERDRKIHEVGGAAFGPAEAKSMDALASDGHGGLLLADGEANRVWRINPADGSTTELVGKPRADGKTPATTEAAMDRPRGVAVAPTGEIYVAENGHSRLWQLTTDGTPSLLVGWGGGGDAFDGFFIGGSFKDPKALAVAPDGSVLVVDHKANRLRRVRARDGAGVATTFDLPLDNPRGVAVGADGTIYLIQDQDASIRFLKPRN
ncbi:MAG: SMP-30/Gluconolaconase/LRE domain protein [Cyanobacteria bacterium RYN_339]|nr:SMP-30/Gluconolaconase/LRE domain protein [Cyanobacteria bacterium RYN_339]